MPFFLELSDFIYLSFQFIVIPMILISILIVLKKGLSKNQWPLLVPYILIIAVMIPFPYLARENIKSILSEPPLIFEAVGIKNEDKVLEALKSLKFIPDNNAHPTGNKITIKIVTTSNRKTLFMYKDYLEQDKYWLYDSDYRYSTNNNIGYIIIKE